MIIEFGVHRGRHLAALTALRDTFTGFPEVSAVDAASPAAVPGRFAVAMNYPQHLRDVLDAHEDNEHLRHIRRTLLIQGDVRDTLPHYLEQNPQTIIALAYFDLDLYEPTRDTLRVVLPYLSHASVLAFDQPGHAKWPGETAALRDILGTDHAPLKILPGRATPSYLRWGSQ